MGASVTPAIRVFGGGGGVIIPEIDALHDYGVARIYSPEDGQKMGLRGMIEDMINRCDISGEPRQQWTPAHWLQATMWRWRAPSRRSRWVSGWMKATSPGCPSGPRPLSG